jgi:hypothetical protein
MSEELEERIRLAVRRRGLVSIMNDTKWRELETAVRSQLLFPPPYQIKYVLNAAPEPEPFAPGDSWGDWSHESLYPFADIEWMRVRPRALRRRGRSAGPDGWSVESRFLGILHRHQIPYRHDGESVWVYGYAADTGGILLKGVEAAPPVVHPLAESDRYLLGHIRESVLLVDKVAGTKAVIGHHTDDPQAGLITPDEQWAISGGEGVLCQRRDGEQRVFFRPGHPPDAQPLDAGAPPAIFVHDLRLDNHGKVRVLLRPWAPYASVWQIDPASGAASKVRDGPFQRRYWWHWPEF